MRNRLSLIATVLAVAIAGVVTSAPARAETSIEISLKNRYLKLLDDGEVIGKYPVAIGAPESPTVPGQFAVTKMDAALVYHKKGKVIAPGPQNPVGFAMWLTFRSARANMPFTARHGRTG